ncbi:CLUMA_CG003930, isoform A [Clunio marinus]|uniref:CLUMA_CG003930, isoform A n=1 Tax=Clunio marinus TaxID=568069 RepID=A0A1J1HQ77_9DIPT|nr:CLUMA_CG003930, isoform A [Clunio marinus]
MKRLFKFAFILSLFILTSSTNQKCSVICPDIVDLNFHKPLIEVILENLYRAGPSDGVCLDGKERWIVNGTQLNLPPKCICLTYPMGEDIKRGEGPKCPDHLAAAVEETIEENLIRNYKLLGDTAPEDGWCDEGKLKRIILASEVDDEKNICVCMNGYNFYSPEVICIDDD